MQNYITETLLEMHYFKAIVADLVTLFGDNVRFMRLLKPSPKREAWVGFDQGWAFTTVSTNDLFQQISDAVQNQTTSISNFYLGYFLQFKVVEQATTRKDSELNSMGFRRKHYRAKLSLKPNKATKISQHETLVRVSGIENANVSYVCPMLFDMEEVFRDARIDDLRCVDIRTAPEPTVEWFTQKSHYIAFRDQNDSSPAWCSEPHKGTALSFREWARKSLRELSGDELKTLLLDTAKVAGQVDRKTWATPLPREFTLATRFVPECFTILELQRTANQVSVAPRRKLRR